MLDQSMRTAILELHEKGHGIRTIARTLEVSRGAVREVVRAGHAEVPRLDRPEKAAAHEADIRELYARCEGNLIRVHEELASEGAVYSYQALTAFCRRHGIGHEPKRPAGRYHFEPGQEMQHDTSPHKANIGGVERPIQIASLVLCFSRMLFFQLFTTFNRFICKSFLDQAFRYFDALCHACMIDNTHVVVLRGTGADMVPVPEMAAFAERYGFKFIAHEKGDANRSARVERPFHYIQNNFLAGRRFKDFAHANREAQAWCDKVNASFKKHLHATPRELFVQERPSLVRLPLWVPEVYALHHRIVDLEGNVHVGGHIYSVPYPLIGRPVEVRETKDKVRVFQGPRLVAEHERVDSHEKRRSTLPEHRPPRGTAGTQRQLSPDERELLEAEAPLPEYVAVLKKKSSNRWPVALRRLAQMRRDYPREAFMKSIRAAVHYGLYDLERLERMVLRNIAGDYFITPDDGDDEEEPDDEG